MYNSTVNMPKEAEGQPRPTLGGEEVSDIQGTPFEQASSANDNKRAKGDVDTPTPTDCPVAEGSGSPVRKKRKGVQFEPVVTCLGTNNSRPETAELRGDGNELSDSNVPVNSAGCEDVGGEPVEDVGASIKRMIDEAKQLMLRWKETFTESEAFEQFCPTRMDELLKEALSLEQSLIQQKETLKSRLERISQTLKLQ